MGDQAQMVHAVDREADEAAEAQGVRALVEEPASEGAADGGADLQVLEEVAQDVRDELLARSGVPEADAGEVPRSALRLSENFRLAEFHCKDGTPVPAVAVPALLSLAVEVLQPMRDAFGACRVVSGYRTRPYNARVGGATRSQHVYEDGPASVAADVVFAQGGPAQWRSRAKELLGQRGGIGLYSTFLHVDNRADEASWIG